MSYADKFSQQVGSVSPVIDEIQLGSIVSHSIDLLTDYNDQSGYRFPVAQCTSDIHIRDLLDFSYLSNNSYEYEN
jgi:hypothetical protein